ncbi:MAG TPA: sulfatase-like hydrolase/transferase [Thermoanaerobaculia bacterium]|jgi:tetratricopeptide (TPR) repeat protein|nr:sulfatase-like hydrolase/transferase [Thermoanaerobaculia bacterium]
MRRSFVLPFLFLIGCRASERPVERPPVILISIDTLRSDHLPAYGYRGVETPALDRFRRDAVLFEHAYSHCPLTLPSHATMLTGRLPADTGLRDNVGFTLDKDVPTLAELLRGAGYRTGAAVSAFVLRGSTGLARGFETYDDHIASAGSEQPMALVQRSGSSTAALARAFVEAHPSEPFFVFLHLYEPHAPYDAPEPYRSRTRLPYDAEIAHADAIVGDFLQFLRDRGLYDRALILIVSDHGEGLGDHGEDEHGVFLYREAIQVPLLMKLPSSRFAGRSVASTAALSDVFGTVLQQCGVTTASHSLLDVATRPVYSESLYPRFHFGWSELHSMIDGAHHAIRAPSPELYDLAHDPAERTNAVSSSRREFNALSAAMEPLVRASSAPAPIDPEEAAKLAALGYVSASATTAPGESLPDPKARIGDLAEIKRATALYREGRYDQAVASLRRIVDANPRMVDVWEMLSRAYAQLGHTEEAIRAAKDGLRVAPTAMHLAIDIANLSLDRDPDDAARHAELALRSDPARAHEILARIALRRGDLAAAERAVRSALAANGERVQPLLTLARIQLRRPDPAAALTTLDEAARAAAPALPPALPLLRGDALARLGRGPEAEASFRDTIRLTPHDPAAYQSLTVLLASEGRYDEATATIRALAAAAPTPAGYAAIVQTLTTLGDEEGARYWAGEGRRRWGK